jgi:hypothetical protein
MSEGLSGTNKSYFCMWADFSEMAEAEIQYEIYATVINEATGQRQHS